MTFLTKKLLTAGEIITIKMQTAEELICQVVKDDVDTLTVSHPLTLTYSAQGVGMTPWVITADQDLPIVIAKDKIMATATTMQKAKEQYAQGTSGTKPVGRI